MDCDDHSNAFSPKKHPDAGMKTHKVTKDHKRAAIHPQHHTKGQLPSQMNPDHGPRG